MWDSLDPLCPQRLVQLWVDPYVGGPHCLLGKVDDGLDGPRGTLFEGAAVDAFVEMDGVFTADDVLEGRTGLAASLVSR